MAGRSGIKGAGPAPIIRRIGDRRTDRQGIVDHAGASTASSSRTGRTDRPIRRTVGTDYPEGHGACGTITATAAETAAATAATAATEARCGGRWWAATGRTIWGILICRQLCRT